MEESTCRQETNSFESDSVSDVFTSLWLRFNTLLQWVLSFLSIDNILARTVLSYVGLEKRSLTVARKKKTASVTVVKDAETCEELMQGYMTSGTSCPHECNFLGMDCEWVNKPGTSNCPVALLQLATPQNECFLIQLVQMNCTTLPKSLQAVLEDRRILKFGVGILEDAKKLANRYGITVRGCVDLRHVVLRCRGATEKEDKSQNGKGSKKAQKMGLQALAERIIGVKMDKHWKIRCSDWEAEELTTRQMEYAANDALVAVHIFLQLVILKGKEVESRSERGPPSYSSDGATFCSSHSKAGECAQKIGEVLSDFKVEDIAYVPANMREDNEEGEHDTEDWGFLDNINSKTSNSIIASTYVGTSSNADFGNENSESEAVVLENVGTKNHDRDSTFNDKESATACIAGVAIEKARETVERGEQVVSSVGSVDTESNGCDNSVRKTYENVAGSSEMFAALDCGTDYEFDSETSLDAEKTYTESEPLEATANTCTKEYDIGESTKNNCIVSAEGAPDEQYKSVSTKFQSWEENTCSLHKGAPLSLELKIEAQSMLSSYAESAEAHRNNSKTEIQETTTVEKAELQEMCSDQNESNCTENIQKESSSQVSCISSSRSFEPVVVTMDLNKLEIISKQDLGYITEVDDLLYDPMFSKRAISLCQGIIDQGFKVKSQNKKAKQKKPKATKIDSTDAVKSQKSQRYIVQVKKNLPYSQCVLLAPDGARLCTLGRKKADWYLDNKLGELVAEDPYTVQLKFEPAGRPKSKEDYYLTFKENVCVVCGKSEAFLSKSIVPRDYRQHFPTCLKDHHSHDILVMCPECHRVASDHDLIFRMKLAEAYGAPIGNKASGAVARLVIDQDLRKVQSAAKAILYSGDKLPDKRKEILFGIVQEHYGNREITEDMLQLAATMSIKKLNCDYKSHGEEVVKKVFAQGKLLEFEKAWRQHFLDTMSPRYMPPFWSVDHRHEDLREKLSL